jgi:hypothetical protein
MSSNERKILKSFNTNIETLFINKQKRTIKKKDIIKSSTEGTENKTCPPQPQQEGISQQKIEEFDNNCKFNFQETQQKIFTSSFRKLLRENDIIINTIITSSFDCLSTLNTLKYLINYHTQGKQ